jgi:hypothetical protein
MLVVDFLLQRCHEVLVDASCDFEIDKSGRLSCRCQDPAEGVSAALEERPSSSGWPSSMRPARHSCACWLTLTQTTRSTARNGTNCHVVEDCGRARRVPAPHDRARIRAEEGRPHGSPHPVTDRGCPRRHVDDRNAHNRLTARRRGRGPRVGCEDSAELQAVRPMCQSCLRTPGSWAMSLSWAASSSRTADAAAPRRHSGRTSRRSVPSSSKARAA